MIQKEVREAIKEIKKWSDEQGWNLSLDTVESICLYQFRYLFDEMKRGEKDEPGTFRNILLRGLGSFVFSEDQINYLRKLKEEKDADRSDGGIQPE